MIYVRDANLWTPEHLGSLEALQRGLREVAHVARVDGLFNLRTVEGRRGRVDAQLLLDSVPETRDQALAARDRALANPMYRQNFFFADGYVTTLVVTLEEIEEQPGAAGRVFEGIEKVLAVHGGDFERVFQVGPPRISVELTRSLFADMVLLGPLAALVLIVAIVLFLRSAMAALLPVITSALTVIWTLGLLGWTGLPLNILSAMIQALIIVIGSTEDTHIVAAYFRGLAKGETVEHTRLNAVHFMTRHMGLPLVLTVLTTTLGFASNLFSEIIALEGDHDRAFQEPANIVRVAGIQRFIERQGAFDSSLSIADHLAFVHREFAGRFSALALPETRQLIAQYLLIFHRADLESYVSHDYRRANIVVRHNINDSHALNTRIRELEDVINHVASPELKVTITGENLLVNRAAENLLRGQVKALGILLVLIFLIMSAMFISFKGGAIALIPAVIPLGKC